MRYLKGAAVIALAVAFSACQDLDVET